MDQVQYAITIVEAWEQPMKRFKSSIAAADRMRVKDPFRDMPRSVDQLRRNIERYKKAADGTFRTDHLRKYNMLIEQTEKKIRLLEGAQTSAFKKAGMLSGAMRMFPGMGVAGAIYGGFRLGKDSLMNSAEFEKYNITLRTMLGSQGAARERMTEYADIAKKTPFELNQVVQAGNQLQAIGRYSRSNLTMLGDLAAASGKPIEQVLNAYAKLSTGQKGEGVNMFRDLLISSKDWAEATGKGIKKNGEIAATTDEMINALPKILQKKGFFGMMDQQAKTTEGKISNLSDSFYMLKESAGEKMKPAFDKFISGTTNIVESMNKWVAVPVPEKIAREKAELNALVGVITDANTKESVRSDLLRDLQQQYPEFLKGIDLETLKNEELRKELEKVNDAYDRKLRLASMKGLYSEAEQNYETVKGKLGDAQLALYAQEEINKTRSGVLSILNSKGKVGLADNVVNSALADNVSKAIKGYYNGNTLGYSDDDMQKLIEWSSNWSTYKKFDSMWSSPEGAVKKYSAEFAIAKKQMEFRKKQLGEESEDPNPNPNSNPTPDPTGGLNLGQATNTIDGGGRMVKQINVNIESLIGNNTNQFRDTDSVQDADNFMEKLSDALQLVVNDVNYSAG